MIRDSASSAGARVRSAGTTPVVATALAVLCLLAVQGALGSEPEKPAEFKYAGGTEDVVEGCSGLLQLGPQSMTFRCAQYIVSIPYDGIQFMQYRAGVSREVHRMKLKWKVRPPDSSGNRNRYFTVVYRTSSTPHVIVLDIPSGGMLPYLAEIDLKAGRRVDVQRHEDYE